MNRDKFIECLDRPGSLDSESVEQIRDVLQQYPYFQTAHLLLVKNLSNLKDMRFNSQLRLAAAYAGDRKVLFELVNNYRSSGEIPKEVLLIDNEADIESVEDAEKSDVRGEADLVSFADESLLEIDSSRVDQEEDSDSEKKNISKIRVSASESHSFCGWLDMFQSDSVIYETSEIKAPQANRSEPVKKLDHQGNDKSHELIDRFLREKPRIEPRSPLDEISKPVDMSADSTRDSDEFFTETLAKIYIQQKYYKKAIYAYEKLCLKYPEKYSYFADQIDKIKKNINQ